MSHYYRGWGPKKCHPKRIAPYIGGSWGSIPLFLLVCQPCVPTPLCHPLSPQILPVVHFKSALSRHLIWFTRSSRHTGLVWSRSGTQGCFSHWGQTFCSPYCLYPDLKVVWFPAVSCGNLVKLLRRLTIINQVLSSISILWGREFDVLSWSDLSESYNSMLCFQLGWHPA